MKTDKANNTLGLHVNQHDVTYQTMHHVDLSSGHGVKGSMAKLIIANNLADWLETTSLISSDDYASVHVHPRADGLGRTKLSSMDFCDIEPKIHPSGLDTLHTLLIERLDNVSLNALNRELLNLAAIVLSHRALARALARALVERAA